METGNISGHWTGFWTGLKGSLSHCETVATSQLCLLGLLLWPLWRSQRSSSSRLEIRWARKDLGGLKKCQGGVTPIGTVNPATLTDL